MNPMGNDVSSVLVVLISDWIPLQVLFFENLCQYLSGIHGHFFFGITHAVPGGRYKTWHHYS